MEGGGGGGGGGTRRESERMIADGGGSRYQIEPVASRRERKRPRREDGISAVGRSR